MGVPHSEVLRNHTRLQNYFSYLRMTTVICKVVWLQRLKTARARYCNTHRGPAAGTHQRGQFVATQGIAVTYIAQEGRRMTWEREIETKDPFIPS